MMAAKLPLRMRLKAWWDGYDLEVKPRARKAIETPHHEVHYEDPQEHWNTGRLRLVQEVWGRGFTMPGARDYVEHLVKPCGLNPAMSLLDIGAGLGGDARIMAEAFGAWVTGLERDEQLVAAAQELSTKAGLAKKADVQIFDPEQVELKQRAYDCVFSREMLCTIKNKERLFGQIAQALKSGGQLLFTDYVVAKPRSRTPPVQSWIQSETLPVYPWAVDEYVTVLGAKGFDIRVTENITEDMRKFITQGWAEYLLNAQRGGLTDAMAPLLVEEVELWTRRVQALDSGDLQVCRVHALKKSGGMLMSDW